MSEGVGGSFGESGGSYKVSDTTQDSSGLLSDRGPSNVRSRPVEVLGYTQNIIVVWSKVSVRRSLLSVDTTTDDGTCDVHIRLDR